MPTRSTANVARNAVGPLLRDWRVRRRFSQLDLALEIGVSARHLSFIETGRSKPSTELLLALADGLDVPLRERNRLLLAAGYAPRFAENSLQADAMKPVKSALQRLLDAHDPYPGVVLDRQWNVVLANRAASSLMASLPEALRTPVVNIFRASLHPLGFAAHTVNFHEWAGYLLETLHRAAVGAGDKGLSDLVKEIHGYPNIKEMRSQSDDDGNAEPQILLPFVVDMPQGRMSFFTTLSTFGTPRDVTLDELCVELFYPSNAETEQMLRGASHTRPSN